MGIQFKLKPFPHVVRIKDFYGWQAGTAKLMLISIDREHVANKRLYIHELVHVFQTYFWTVLSLPILLITLPWIFGIFALTIHGLLYTFVSPYKVQSEAMAYGIASHYGDDHVQYIIQGYESLSKNYDLPEKYTKKVCSDMIYKWREIWSKLRGI